MTTPPPEAPERRIVGVAIKVNNMLTFSLPPPNRHAHIFLRVREALGESEVIRQALNASEQGFLDSAGNFLDRAEAMNLAKATGVYPADKPKTILYSEDLW